MVKRWTSREVTEICSTCMSEVTLHWKVEEDGYKAYCPYCGSRLMLCDICPIHEVCGYDSETDSCPMMQDKCLNKEQYIEYLLYSFDISDEFALLIVNCMDWLHGHYESDEQFTSEVKRMLSDIIPLTQREINMIKF